MNDHQKKFSVFSASRGKITSSPIFCRGGEQIASPHYPRPFSLLPRPFSLRGSRGGPPTFCGVLLWNYLPIIDVGEGYFASPHPSSDWSTPHILTNESEVGGRKISFHSVNDLQRKEQQITAKSSLKCFLAPQFVALFFADH